MNRKEFLATVEGIICIDRNNTHGEPENVFPVIAAFWGTYLKARHGAELGGHDVAALMVLFKIARHAFNPSHADNPLDACGYSAIMGELAPGADHVG